jgi:beta-xylosidase
MTECPAVAPVGRHQPAFGGIGGLDAHPTRLGERKACDVRTAAGPVGRGRRSTRTGPTTRWVDEGLVLRSRASDNFNAIDPDLSFDEDGEAWMAFGSSWSGLKLRRMDATTGMPSERDTTLYPLVDRQEPPNAFEGPSIVHHEGFYYLFVSFDFCCRGLDSTYRVVVGRSAEITGPYVDESGQSMLEGGSTEVLSGYDNYAGPGHGDVFVEGTTMWYPHHYYDRTDGGAPKLSVRELTWNDGWPSLSEPLSGSG